MILRFNMSWSLKKCSKLTDFIQFTRKLHTGVLFHTMFQRCFTHRLSQVYVDVFVACILSVRLLKFLPVFSIFNAKWGIFLEFCHIHKRLSLWRNFTLELRFTRCSKDVSLTDWAKECFMGCNLGFPKRKPHLLIRQ